MKNGLCSRCLENIRYLEDGIPVPPDCQELEGGALDQIETVEEVRRALGILLQPRVMTSLLTLKCFLDEVPNDTEKYTWFIRSSPYGKDCKYALAAAQHFKESKLPKTLGMIREILEECTKD